jgi:DNA repair photolyase
MCRLLNNFSKFAVESADDWYQIQQLSKGQISLRGYGLRVTFLTKGVIPQKHMRLLADHAPFVSAEIGLITLNNAVGRLFEPAAARAGRRLAQISELVRNGIKTEVRLDPIIPGFTDDEPSRWYGASGTPSPRRFASSRSGTHS